MMSVTPVSSAGSAGSYYAADNYYSSDQSAEASAWFGQGAETLGLAGHVDTEAFRQVLEGKLPDGSVLGAARGDHRPGLDLTFSAPKSVSLLALVTGDQRIVVAFKESVGATLGWAEKNLIQARVWNSEAQRQVPEKTGNMVAATFLHDQNRNNDPQLHIHTVLGNATLASDGKWHAIHNDSIYQSQHLLGTIQNSELRARIEALGYETTPARNPIDGAFEIKGVSREAIEAFSTRRAEITAALDAEGRGTAREREIAALATRDPKSAELSPEAKQAAWSATAEQAGFDGRALMEAALSRAEAGHSIWERITDAARSIGAKGMALASAMGLTPKDGDALVPERMGRLEPREFAAAQAVASAARELGEREAAFDRHDLIQLALSRGGPVQLADVEARIAGLEDKGLLIGGERMVTTESAVALEQRVIDAAKSGESKVQPILAGDDAAPRLHAAARELGLNRLNPGQEQAGVTALQSPNRVELIQGAAGTGKSAALIPVAQIAKDQGHDVFALAHAGRTARDFGAKLGAPARTVDSFLGRYARILDGSASPQQMALAREVLGGAVIMVDEASQIGNDRLGKLIELAGITDVAKLFLAGDTRQLPAIEAGKPFELLQQEGVSTSLITENLRAQSPQMQALNAALEDRDIAAAFAVLKPDTIEVPFAMGPETAAKLWAGLPAEKRDDTLLLASGRAMRSAANEAVQNERMERGELDGEGHRFDVLDRVTVTREGARQLTGYREDRIVEFRTNLPSQDFERGDRGTVIGVENGKVHLEMPSGETKLFEPDRLPRNLAHDAVSIFQEKSINLHEGDQIRWTDNDRARGMLNGDITQVRGIDDFSVQFEDRHGNTIALGRDDPMLERFDLAYAVNAHISQGMTAGDGIALMSEQEKTLNTTQSFLTIVTRIADHITLVVDNVAGLERDISQNPGGKTSALETVPDLPKTPDKVIDAPSAPDMDFGL